MVRSDQMTYRGETRTGEEFGNLIIASADDGQNFYRFLFTEDGEHAVRHPQAGEVANFFRIDFTAGKLDGKPCLLNIESLYSAGKKQS